MKNTLGAVLLFPGTSRAAPSVLLNAVLVIDLDGEKRLARIREGSGRIGVSERIGDLSLIDNYKSLRWVLDGAPYLPAAVSAYLPVTSRITRR